MRPGLDTRVAGVRLVETVKTRNLEVVLVIFGHTESCFAPLFENQAPQNLSKIGRASGLALEVKLLLSEVGIAEGVGERQEESDDE